MNSLELTKKLLAFNTINTPGNEFECAEYIGGLLETIGFQVEYYDFAPKRTSLVAKIPSNSDKKPICFTGHLDVVPLGKAPWTKDPFSGETDNGKLYGRGTSDMKAGITAMLMMARSFAHDSEKLKQITFVFTAGEETCCEGAYYLAGLGNALCDAGALVVGEPTSNLPFIGHKGCIRLDITTKGEAAHASMPELGDNAIYKAAEVIKKLENYNFNIAPHPLLGNPTLVIGRILGGININSVPDRTTMGVDMRTIPGQDPINIQKDIQNILEKDVDIKLLEQVDSITTDPDNEWIQTVYTIMGNILNHSVDHSAASYFTDASVLKTALGNPPCIILGPGEPGMAHKTDEFCHISKIDQAVEAYIEIVRHWGKTTF